MFKFFSKLFLLLSIFVLLFFSYWEINNIKKIYAQDESADAIAIRVMPNPNHYSVLTWYKKQNFQGSPQALTVDSYDAIRDGRTVYVNAANISGNNLYTNIYLISYNQEGEQDTIDIFGRILKHWKFNTNLNISGSCHDNSSLVCYVDKDCPQDDYCLSLKAKIIRDTRRLSDLTELRDLLNKYKEETLKYPDMRSGTYIPGKTVSTWPSWQNVLAKIIHSDKIVVDPINRMGDCCPFSNSYCNSSYNYNKFTCWDEKHKDFAGDIPGVMPSGSRVYAYNFHDNLIDICAQLETNYSNISSFGCFQDKAGNHSPQITGINLSARHNEEVEGFLKGFDPDGDKIKWKIDFIDPLSPSTWLSLDWKWDVGVSGFSLLNTYDPNQIRIHAKQGGLAIKDNYKIKITLDDGQGESNSVISKEYTVVVRKYPLILNEAKDSAIIGHFWSYNMTGTDANLRPLLNIEFLDSSLVHNGSEQNIAKGSLGFYGFSINGMQVNENFASLQKTGQYILNVQATDPLTFDIVQSSIKFSLINNPPVINNITAYYINGSNGDCKTSCAIDNGEKATIKVQASDSDGHTLSYSLLDNLGGKISINSSSGVISGLEKLNLGELSEKKYTIKVKVSDQYCSNSSEKECSIETSFDLKVLPFCSLLKPASVKNFKSTAPITLNSGEEASLMGILSNCSEIDGNAKITLLGEVKSKAIVFVLDTSYSMEKNVNGSPAIDQMKEAAKKVLDKIYNIAKNLPSNYNIKIGLVAFNHKIYPYPSSGLVDIVNSGELSKLKDEIDSYVSDKETNTFNALIEAEKKLDTITNPEVEKNIILLSDGLPTIGQNIYNGVCHSRTCGCKVWCRGGSGFLQSSSFCASSYEACCKDGYRFCYHDYNCYLDDDEFNTKCTFGGTPTSCPCGTSSYGGCHWPPSCGSGYHDINPDQCTTDCAPIIGKADFRISSVSQTQCFDEKNGCQNNANCDTSQCEYCFQHYDFKSCNMNHDVSREAESIKGKKINIYTIYYQTGKEDNIKTMCEWSSASNWDCAACPNNPCGGHFSFFGDNIDYLFNEFLKSIIMKPEDLKINDKPIADVSPFSVKTINHTISLNPMLQCGAPNSALKVTFSGDGSLEMKDIDINYCPAKLHSINTCIDNDHDGYGVCPNCGINNGCTYNGNDCDDSVLGADKIKDTFDDGKIINPSQADDCSQYDSIDNNCDGQIDEHADILDIITNTGFENGIVGSFPAGWSGMHELHSSLGITTNEAMSESKSMILRQDKNLDYPGKCSQSICNDLSSCSWNAGSAICNFSGTNYNIGETLTWPNTNRTMKTSLYYDVSSLGFNAGDKYIMKFYYKGNVQFDGTLSSQLSSPLVPDADYLNWTLYNKYFTYSDDLFKISGGSPSDRKVEISVGYNSTGSQDSNIYIDNFQLLECKNK